jgi:hypothetical protein
MLNLVHSKLCPCTKENIPLKNGTYREYWSIYRGQGFPAVVGFGSSLTPSPGLPSVTSTGDREEAREREDILMTGEGERGWGRRQIKSYDG